MTDSLPARSECDLVVVGSGAAGLATAVTAAWLGLDVIVVEKEDRLGGTTAWSGGWLWIPRNPLAIAAGIVEDIDAPARYLRHELGTGYDDARIAMFLAQGPRMVSFFIANTDVAFVDGNAIPDFHDTSPGAGSGGRSVCAAPFDGRELGPRIRDIKPPLVEISPFGMGIASGADLRHFLDASRKVGSAMHAARRLVRHWLDLARHRRGMHLVAGNALVARLVKSADKLGVRLVMSTPAQQADRRERPRARAWSRARAAPGMRSVLAAAWCWRLAAFHMTSSARPSCSRMRRPAASIIRQHPRAIPAMDCGWPRRLAERSPATCRTPAPGHRCRWCRGRMGRSAASRT